MTPEERAAVANEAHGKLWDGDGPLPPEIVAAYAVVDAMVAAADGMIGGGPYWFGWALREAYLRGVLAERAAAVTRPAAGPAAAPSS